MRTFLFALTVFAVLFSMNAIADTCSGQPIPGTSGTPAQGTQIPIGGFDGTVVYQTIPPTTDPGGSFGNGNGGGGTTVGGGPGGGGSPPGGGSDPNTQTWGTCNGSPPSDNGLARMDSDKVNPKFAAYIGRDYSFESPVQTFNDVWGTNDPSSVPNAGSDTEFYVTLGCYISLQFTPTNVGALQLVANNSFGSGGVMSISESPGIFSRSATNVNGNCFHDTGGANSLYIHVTQPGGATDPGFCHVEVGKTYYLNLSADQGGSACNATSATKSCVLSYTIYTGK